MTGLIVGVGNRYRGDDGAGCIVAEMLRGLVPSSVKIVEHDGEPLGLLSLWHHVPWCIVIDAIKEDVQTTGPSGRLVLLDLTYQHLPTGFGSCSTHGYGVGEAAAMGQALGRVPPHLMIVGIVGSCFDGDAPLSESVKEGITSAVSVVLRMVATLESPRDSHHRLTLISERR